MTITVLGAGGWIGSNLVDLLRRQGRSVRPVNRAELPLWLSERDSQGPVIYAIGLTADFRQRPHATAEAHVCLLSQVLQRPGIRQLLYLSSTRVYGRSVNTRETSPLPCLSSDLSDLYNLSKLLGESLVLQDPRPGLKAIRLSNVIGPGQPPNTFLGALLEEARSSEIVTIQQSADTSKNYVALADVVQLLPLIAENGKQRLYNLGSSRSTCHSEVAAWLESQGATVRFASGTSTNTSDSLSFPPLSVDRLAAEFPPPGNPFNQLLL